jgi:hypothetical protein
MSEKKYVGNSRNQQWKFGEIQKISFSRKDLQLMMDSLNEKGYINLNRIEKKEPDQWGNTHYLVIDDWKPSGQQHNVPTERKTAADNVRKEVEQQLPANDDLDQLPF